MPLGLSLGLEIDSDHEGIALIEVQLEIAAAESLENIFFRPIAEGVELVQCELADFIKIKRNTLINSGEKGQAEFL